MISIKYNLPGVGLCEQVVIFKGSLRNYDVSILYIFCNHFLFLLLARDDRHYRELYRPTLYNVSMVISYFVRFS